MADPVTRDVHGDGISAQKGSISPFTTYNNISGYPETNIEPKGLTMQDMTPTPPPGRFQSWDNWVRAKDREWNRYCTGHPCDWIDFTWDWTDEQRKRLKDHQRRLWLYGRMYPALTRRPSRKD
jgi:hypothetical protein